MTTVDATADKTSTIEPMTRNGTTIKSAGSWYPWFVVGTLWLVFLLAMVERQLLTLLFQPIKQSLLLTDVQVSLLSGFAFILLYAFLGLLFGRIADHGNRKWLIVFGFVVWSIATVLCGFATSFWLLFLARMAVGVGEATLHPSALSMLADYFSGSRLARANSIYLLAGYIGSGVALFVGGAAIQFLSVSHTPLLLLFDSLAIWQKTFVLVGASGFILLIPLAFVREPARLNPSSHGHDEQLEANKTGVLQHLRAHALLYSCIYIAFPLVSLIGYGTVAWMPTYFARVYHWSLHDIGYVYGLIVGCAGALGLLTGGRLLGWVEDRGYGDSPFRVSAWAITLAATFFISAIFTSEFHIVLGLVTLGHFFLGMPVAPGFTALQTVTPNRLRAQVIAIHFCIATPIGPAFGPVLIGAFTDYLFANDLAVGHSIALAWILVAPIIVGAMWIGMGSYRKKMTGVA